jgi:DNA-binding IclR family transcriptional regulator
VPERTSSSRLDVRSVTGKIDTILDAFTISDVELSLAELVRRTDLPKTTTHRLCQACVAWGVLERSRSGYRLGLRLFELGQRVPRQRIIRDAARPVMQDLMFRSHAVVHLGVLDGPEVLVIERLSTQASSPRTAQIAGRMPLHCSAVGKALLAHSSPDLLNEVMRSGLPRRTPYTITAANVLLNSLERTRNEGVAWEIEEMHLGYVAAGSVITGANGQPIAGISATVPLHTVTTDHLADMVGKAARRISVELRPNPATQRPAVTRRSPA